jgi:hypothetical protein
MPDPKTASLDIQRLPLATLKPHPRNPRIHPDEGSPEWDVLKASLAHDYFDPIVWNKRNGMLVSGHLRTKVMLASGFEAADCVVVDYDEPTHIARMIAANKLQGADDERLLKDLLTEIDTGALDMAMTGFTGGELERLMTNAPAKPNRQDRAALLDQSVQMIPPREYVVIVCDQFNTQWDELQKLFGLKAVRRGGYRKGGVYDTLGTERVVFAQNVIENLRKGFEPCTSPSQAKAEPGK